nr:MAG TPA: hypothetical protein [Caudoviricetes sp.]
MNASSGCVPPYGGGGGVNKKNEALFRPMIFVGMIFVGKPVMTGLLDRVGRYTRGRYDVKKMLNYIVLFRLYCSMKSSV